jgi:hypothetical protein
MDQWVFDLTLLIRCIPWSIMDSNGDCMRTIKTASVNDDDNSLNVSCSHIPAWQVRQDFIWLDGSFILPISWKTRLKWIDETYPKFFRNSGEFESSHYDRTDDFFSGMLYRNSQNTRLGPWYLWNLLFITKPEPRHAVKINDETEAPIMRPLLWICWFREKKICKSCNLLNIIFCKNTTMFWFPQKYWAFENAQ